MNEETLKNLSREEAINYLDNEMDYTYQLQKRIDKAIKIIEDVYYSKNTVDIDSVSIPNNKLIQIREILKGDVDE